MHDQKVELFELGIERIQGVSFHAYKENEHLYIQRSVRNDVFGTPTNILIENPNWALFFNIMENHQIWNLDKEYGTDLVATLWWHLNIKTKENKVVSCGVNLFPDLKPIDSSLFYDSLKKAIKQMTDITMPT
jgi:hypothetical protein